MPAKKNVKKPDPMLGALAASFGAAKVAPTTEETATEEAQTPPPIVGRGGEAPTPNPVAVTPAPVPIPAPAKPSAPLHKPVPPVEAGGAGVKKTTVSFHESEQDKIDLILDSLRRSRRHRGGFSDAIKVALRLCPLDDESIAQAWDAARSQDLRVARHRRDS